MHVLSAYSFFCAEYFGKRFLGFPGGGTILIVKGFTYYPGMLCINPKLLGPGSSWESAANLILHPNTLWAWLIASTYKVSSIWVSYKNPKGCSSIWNKICNQGQKNSMSVAWLVGNGQSINFWNDPWFSNISLSHWPSFTDTTFDLSQYSAVDFISFLSLVRL